MGKKLIGIAVIAIMLFGVLGLTGCDGNKVYETEHLKYTIWQSKEITIVGFTELGKQQKTIVIPEKINGIRVMLLSRKTINQEPVEWESDNVEKIFIYSGEIGVFQNVLSGCKNLKKVIVVNLVDGMTCDNILSENSETSCYIYNEFYEARDDWADKTKPANITYYYNFARLINETAHQWIDDVDFGGKIEYIPEVPIREGFTFDGWYQEPECISTWDFETIPSVEESTEFKLYAKWREI